MSDAIVRGEATAAQLYLDGVLNSILQEQGVDPDAAQRARVSLAQLLFYCMKTKWAADDTLMINGATSETITANQLLKHSVSIARSLVARGASGKTVVVVMRNHQRTATIYFAVLFAGVVPFYMDPNATAHEIKYFLELIEPCFVFCDREQYDVVTECLDGSEKVSAAVVVAEDDQELRQFAAGASDNVDNFQVPDTNPGDTVMMLATSGSTGMPKATLLNNKGLILQLCRKIRSSLTEAQPPNTLALILTNAQWPTATFFSPLLAKNLMSMVTSEHMSSLEYLQLSGSHSTADLLSAVKAKLADTAILAVVYGITDTHGIVAISDVDSPLGSTGRVSNIFQYKLIDEDGHKVGPCQEGELYLKGDFISKVYYKTDSSYAESFTADGWFKTGDVFYIDENERLYYKERKNISFKHQDRYVSPERMERVICSVPGVKECVVCGTDRGPAAAVMLQDGCDVTREQIHHPVDSTLSDHSRLSGGIAFVTSLPLTHSWKIKRVDCMELIKQLIESGHCF